MEHLEFKDRSAWRKWLGGHHARDEGIWLALRKKAGGPGLRYEEALEEALCFGWIDSKMRPLDEKRFVQFYSPRRKGSLWSALNKERVLKLIKEGKMTEAGMAKVREAKKNGMWKSAYSLKKDWKMPGDLRLELNRNEAALKNFNAFRRAQRSMYIHWVESAKRAETRKTRIAEVVKRAALDLRPGAALPADPRR